MNRRIILSVAVATAAALFTSAANAGDLTPAAARGALDALDKGLAGYVDPATGEKARAAVRAGRDRYLQLDDRQAFADAISADLLAATGDLHLKLRVNTTSAQTAALSADDSARLLARSAYGLMTVRRLPGNIGYLKLRNFPPGEDGWPTIDAAMLLLKDTDALIIDLRENTGGGGADERLLGHLSRTPIPMAVIRWREADGSFTTTTRKPSAPESGPLYPDKPVFLLIANRTFSAAEEFAYDLQAAKRATLVGETSRGGANPSNRPVELGAGLSAFVPNGLVTHPTTGGNWEGVGIRPDVATPPDQALTEAFARALAVARPTVSTPRSEKELADAKADPRAALDEPL
jgi:C-terminal processing protease CtpA/Prc